MPRTKKDLTDQQKKQITELRDQGLSKDKIGMKLHIAVYKVAKYLDEVGTTDLRGNLEPVDIDMDEFARWVLLGEKNETLCNVFNISIPTCIKLKNQVIKERDINSENDYDLTIHTKDEDNWLVVDIKQELGANKMNLISFETHKDIIIGGERTVWNKHKNGDVTFDKKETYPTEVHKFDIIIPEIKMVIVPVANYEEIIVWWEEHISKKVDPIFKEKVYGKNYNHSYFHLLLVGVSKYDIVFSSDAKDIARKIWASVLSKDMLAKENKQEDKPFQSCTDCQYKDDCSHTYCKARGEKYKPPLDWDRLKERRYRGILTGHEEVAGWANDIHDRFAEVNMEEFKYWDQRGRIGKHTQGALTPHELKEATGFEKDQDVSINAEISSKHLSNTHSMDPGKEFPSIKEVRKFIKSMS